MKGNGMMVAYAWIGIICLAVAFGLAFGFKGGLFFVGTICLIFSFSIYCNEENNPDRPPSEPKE
jgi:uncharacterized membrane protein YccC